MLETYELDWPQVVTQYDYRLDLSSEIRRLVVGRDDDAVDIMLGISDPHANYSAAEHALGPRILSSNINARKRVLNLAFDLRRAPTSAELAKSIKTANLDWLKISVGSEISMMLSPDACWVANVRTIWAHLLVKHDWHEQMANEELELYRDREETSEMAYKKWTAIHKEMQSDMLELAKIGSQIAISEGYKPGAHKFLWADAISNWLYENT